MNDSDTDFPRRQAPFSDTAKQDRIIVDDRERVSGVGEALLAKGYEVTYQRLLVGDYLVNDQLIVERKTLADFAASVVDGRIFRQSNHLAHDHRSECLILEGSSKDVPALNVSREALQGALITVSLIYRVPVLRSMNPQESASLMMYAAQQLHRSRSGAVRRPGGRPRGLRKRKLYTLQSIPGLGPRKAEQLLDHFSSIESIALAHIEDLKTVEGIGPELAHHIHRTLHEPATPYTVRSRCAISELFPL